MKVNSENLYELINDGTIKVNTKIKVYSDDVYKTTITFDGYDFIWETGTFTSGMLFNPLCDFEIIEEEKEIDVLELQENISKLQSEIDLLSNEIGSYHNKIHSMRDRNNYMKETLKDLQKEVRELNKIKKEGKQ